MPDTGTWVLPFCFFWFYLEKVSGPEKVSKKTKVSDPMPDTGTWVLPKKFFLVLPRKSVGSRKSVKKTKKCLTPCQILGHGFCRKSFFCPEKVCRGSVTGTLGHCHFVFFGFFGFSRFLIPLSRENKLIVALQEMDAHQTQVCIVQQMDAYMGLAYLKQWKKM